MGEAREAYTGLCVAQAFSFAEEPLLADLIGETDSVVAVLYTLAHKPTTRA